MRVHGVAARHLVALAALAAVLSPVASASAAGVRYRDIIYAQATVKTGIAYGSALDEHGRRETLRMDTFSAVGDATARRPAIVFVHAGGFAEGSRTAMHNLASKYARRGYFTVSISYRLREGSEWTGTSDPALRIAVQDAQHDLQAAVRYLRRYASKFRVDPDRIAAVGVSAGGITALEAGFAPNDPGTSGNARYPSRLTAVVAYMGTAIDHHEIGGTTDAPAAMFHGTADELVPFAEGQRTCELAMAAGVPCELTAYEAAAHDLSDNADDITSRTVHFLVRRLRL